MSVNEFPGSPRPAVAVVVVRKGKVLMVLRGNPPAENTWSLPGGSIELGEEVAEAAVREVREETSLVVEALGPVTCEDAIYRDGGRIRFHYVIIYVAARYVSGEVRAGDDARDAGFFSLDELREMRVEKKTMMILEGLLSKPARLW